MKNKSIASIVVLLIYGLSFSLFGMHIFKKNKNKNMMLLVPIGSPYESKKEDKKNIKRRKSGEDSLKDKNVHYFYSQLHKAKDPKKLYREWMFEYHPDADVYEDKQYAQDQTVKINRAKKAFDEGTSVYENVTLYRSQENYYSDGCGHYAGWWGHCTFTVGSDHIHLNELQFRLGRIWLAWVAGSFIWEFIIRDNISFYDSQPVWDRYKDKKWKIRCEKN